MKKLMTICVIMTTILAFSSIALADITDHADYVPSSNLTLGSYDGTKGYQLAEEFQLNLVYQDVIEDSDIDAFNNYNVPTALNFADYDYYYLMVDMDGGLPIGIWDYDTEADPHQLYAPDSGESWVQWTLSYHGSTGYHTILAGDIVDDPFLRVRPTAGYRTFLWDGLANDVEIFGGATIDCEVLGYILEGELASGISLTPKLVPIPGAVLLGILGLGVVGIKLCKFA